MEITAEFLFYICIHTMKRYWGNNFEKHVHLVDQIGIALVLHTIESISRFSGS
jgi:hypothetical protein